MMPNSDDSRAGVPAHHGQEGGVSATRMAYHLDEARTSIDTASWHLRAAYQHDPDPEVATEVYLTVLKNLDKICTGLVVSRKPDLDREAKGEQ